MIECGSERLCKHIPGKETQMFLIFLSILQSQLDKLINFLFSFNPQTLFLETPPILS